MICLTVKLLNQNGRFILNFYNRQTQWDPPTWDAPAEDLIGKKEGDMEISTPVDEEATKKVELVAGC